MKWHIKEWRDRVQVQFRNKTHNAQQPLFMGPTSFLFLSRVVWIEVPQSGIRHSPADSEAFSIKRLLYSFQPNKSGTVVLQCPSVMVSASKQLGDFLSQVHPNPIMFHAFFALQS